MRGARSPPLVNIGLSSFVLDYTFTVSKQLFNQQVEEQLEQNCLTLTHNQFYQLRWPKIFVMMYKSQIDTLKIESLETSMYNYKLHDDLFHCLAQVKFHNLRILNLFCCAVVSIEAFAWVDMPNLERLQSVYNYINSFDGLVKFTSTPHLRDLFVYTHVDTRPDMRAIHRMKSMFSCIGLEIKGKALIICEDLSLLAKIPIFVEYRRSWITVKIKKNKRIEQRLIKKVLGGDFVHRLKFVQAVGQTQPQSMWDLGFMGMLGVALGSNMILETVDYYRNYYEPPL